MKRPTNRNRGRSSNHLAEARSRLTLAAPLLFGAFVLTLLLAPASCRRGERPAAAAPVAKTAEDEGKAADPSASDSAEYTDESASDADESVALPDDATDESTGGDWVEKDADAPEETYDDAPPEPSDDYGEPSYDESAGDDEVPGDDSWEG